MDLTSRANLLESPGAARLAGLMIPTLALAGLAAVTWAASNEANWNNPKLHVSAHPFPSRRVPPLPADAAADIRTTLLSAAENAANPYRLRAEFLPAVPKARIQAAGDGIYELDLNPGGSKGFPVPDLAVALDGGVILYYTDFLGDSGRFEELLGSAGIFVRQDEQSRIRFYAAGAELTTLQAFGRLAAERFMAETAWGHAPSPLEQSSLREAFASAGIIPLGVTAGDEALRAYHVPKRRFLELQLRRTPSTLDLKRTLLSLP